MWPAARVAGNRERSRSRLGGNALDVMCMDHFIRLLLLALVTGSMAAAQPVPPELSTLAATARLDRPVVGWCRGEFRSGHPGAYAVAVSGEKGGGRYLVLESDATVVELAGFTDGPQLSCYTPAEARKLDLVIGSSLAIHGQITPAWNTAVVCAFEENTRATCWQHSPVTGAFVKVGGWIT